MDKLTSRAAIVRERERSSRFVKITLGTMALASVVLGLGVTSVAQPVGLPEDAVWPVAMAFLYLAIGATAVLYAWGRIFKPHS